MNATKVNIFPKFSHEHLCEEFNNLSVKYMSTIKRACHHAIFIPENEEKDDYIQEALIYCWEAFQRHYDGPAAPRYKDGSPSNWDDWFFFFAKFGALATLQRLHPKNRLKVRLFNALPEWFDPSADQDEYNFEEDKNLEKMDVVIDQQPEQIASVLKAYIRSNLSYSETCRMLGGGNNNSASEEIKWCLAVLKYKLRMEVDPAFFQRYKGEELGKHAKFVGEFLYTAMLHSSRRQETIFAYDSIISAFDFLGLNDIQVNSFGIDELAVVLNELRNEKYQQSSKPVIYKRRISSLFDYFVDLGLLGANPLSGIEFKVSKTGTYRPSKRVRVRPKRDYIFDTNRPVKGVSEAGEVIVVYSRVCKAIKDGYGQSAIADVVCGFRKSHKGLVWSYAGDANVGTSRPSRKVRKQRTNMNCEKSGAVVRMDMSGAVIEIFDSLKEASKFGFRPDQIQRVIAGEMFAHAKSRWAYSSSKQLTA